jgi:Ca-activated chloride channel family protein
MSLKSWARAPRIRRGLAAAAVVLAAGGLVLFRADAKTTSPYPLYTPPDTVLPAGSNVSSFAGPGVHGTFGLSHSNVLAGGTRQLFADVTLVADPSAQARESAPLAMAIALDTSGSMSGDKIAQARSAISRLLRDMKDSDDVALVRYSDSAELVQPLARVGSIRESLIARVNALQAGGGTAIPLGLEKALDALAGEHSGRVRRVVLVSDGLDSSRAQSEQLARSSFGRGIVISSMGIGLDFDESYMGGLARAGHGNFGFVNDGPALAMFLKRELEETAGTTVEGASVRVALPAGVRFVRATGADAQADGSGVLLQVGSMFAGEERRVLVELSANMNEGSTGQVYGSASWQRVGSGPGTASIPALALVAVADPAQVDRSRDGTVLARAASVTASERQLEASEAYAKGDNRRADALIDQNIAALHAARAFAPAPMASALAAQSSSYESTKQTFDSVAPSSTAGKIHAKASAAKNFANSAGASSF